MGSRNVKTRGGYIQGYNAQATVTAGQIVIAAEIFVSSPDFGLLEPALDATLSELAAVGVSDMPDVLVADAGYWHHVQMQQIVNDGIQVLIPPDAATAKAHDPDGAAGARVHAPRSWHTARHGRSALGRALVLALAEAQLDRRYRPGCPGRRARVVGRSPPSRGM